MSAARDSFKESDSAGRLMRFDYTIAAAPMADVGAETVTKKYWAFISYSHVDAAFATRLQTALETYRIPKSLVGRVVRNEAVPPRLNPIFRDRAELSSAPDLRQSLNLALGQSRHLIVVCSPTAAHSQWVNEEIRAFSTLENGGVFCVIADTPSADGTSETADPSDCFPPALFQGQAHTGTTEKPSEPLAADARPAEDGWKNAKLKLIAGILGIEFDDLNRREQARRQRQLAIRTAAAGVALMLATGGYVVLADARAPLPAAGAIRHVLDRHDVTWSRPVPRTADVQAAALRQRKTLVLELDRRWRRKDWYLPDPTSQAGPKAQLDVWLASQVASGMLRWDGSSELDPVLTDTQHIFDAAFAPGMPVESGGKRYVWRVGQYIPGAKEILGPDEGMGSPLWLGAAISLALAHPGLIADANKQRLLDDLALSQAGTRPYDAGDGGWNFFPNQIDGEQHSTYAAALALLALLEMKSAGLGWGQSIAARDARLQATAAWLIGTFSQSAGGSGWRGAPSEGETIIDGLSWQIYGELLRSEAEAGVRLPEAIVRTIEPQVASLIDRTGAFRNMATIYRRPYRGANGATMLGVESMQYAWQPWAIETCVWWIRRLERHRAPRETILEARRALGHLVVDLGDDTVHGMIDGIAFPLAETAYALASAASTQSSPLSFPSDKPR